MYLYVYSTKRVWLPNVHRKRLYSEILDSMITIPVTTHVLRHMDRVGGFDEYLLRAHPGQLGSRKGEQLRKQLIQTLRTKENDTKNTLLSSSSSVVAKPNVPTELR